ncbi:DnaC replication protein [Virgibacillus halodenitrificans]|uniref:DnaC replication protein n=1 Tax=Virgibacillus halodenitrificans TaxID=1482 RepID=A0AAC9J002_VIRHA|nr:ATP-binding protein [Virgibacillus halodenitrificans]APC48274.1 DnaC replication protein [Virgibacillus halodenitrificans]
MEQISLFKPKERLIITYECEGCGRTVQKKEMQITGGPNKGDWIEVNAGCKCEDLKLAEEAGQRRVQLRNEKMKQFFDYYSLMNDNLKSATLENYEPTSQELATAKQNITNYIQEFDGKKNLLLHGSYGTGKSHLSVAITKKVMEKKKECLFLSLPKLLTKIKETYNNKGVTEDELLAVIQRVDLLVLDDIGAEHHTEWANTKLFEILDDRSGKSTIYTTNLNSKELRAQINERNFSRMMENTEIITMNGRDYRRKEF